jgi:hypothetical protein
LERAFDFDDPDFDDEPRFVPRLFDRDPALLLLAILFLPIESLLHRIGDALEIKLSTGSEIGGPSGQGQGRANRDGAELSHSPASPVRLRMGSFRAPGSIIRCQEGRHGRAGDLIDVERRALLLSKHPSLP